MLLVLFGGTGCGQEKTESSEITEESVMQETVEVQEVSQSAVVEREETGPWLSPSPTAGEAAGPQRPTEKITPTLSVTSVPSVTPMPSAASAPSAAPIPSATPTEAPMITPVPLPGSMKSEGTLSKPDHPETVVNDRLVFIGDSRTEGIRDAVNDTSVWSCLSGKGYDWMVTTGVPQVESEIGQNTAVIFLMGVNDPYHVSSYINYISEKANEWSALGARTYFVSVGPVESDPYVTNAQIESFNASMEKGLSGVKYIDIYTHLTENGFSTVDGLHYTENVSIEIYNYIIENLEEVRSGIWG